MNAENPGQPQSSLDDLQKGRIQPLRVVIVEDETEMRALLIRNVSMCKDVRIVFDAGTCTEALHFFSYNSADVLLVDLGLPDGNGLELIRSVTASNARTDIIVISVFGDERHVCDALAAGATGYLLKDSLPDDICSALRLLRDGGAPINPIIARLIVRQMQKTGAPNLEASSRISLTEREQEILNFIARGFTTAEVAGLIKLSPHTVVSHVKKIYRKLHVNSRSEALYEAGQLGLLR